MSKALPFRTRFAGVPKVSLKFDPEGRRTKSEFKNECDINQIMAKYRRTGVLPPSALSAAKRYGDFSDVPSYQDMQHRVIAANELFAALPAKVREQFGNDPGRFIEASQTDEGVALMKHLGLGREEIEASEPPSPAAPDPVPAGQAAPSKKKSGASSPSSEPTVE